MEINTTINIDMDNLANELEDFIREIAQDQMNGNEPCFQDDDDVQAMINDALTDAEILNAGDVEQLFADTFLDLRNEVGKLRRSVHVLLEDLELIQWKPYDHWLVTDSQEVLESKQGTVY